MSDLICPECGQKVNSVRGYLDTHNRDIQRGALVTGSGICPLSNTKIVYEKRTITYSGDCPNCDTEVVKDQTETFIGEFEEIAPFFEVPCPTCSIPESGEYCEECNQPVMARPQFWRVSDSINKYLPDMIDHRPAITNAQFMDFNTEQEAAEFIETLADFETGRYNLDSMDAGFYDRNGRIDCPTNMNPMTPGEHYGVHRDAHTQLVTVTDNHVIYETPEGDREEVSSG